MLKYSNPLSYADNDIFQTGIESMVNYLIPDYVQMANANLDNNI